MRLELLFITLAAVATAIASPLAKRLTGPQGMDVSNWQNTIDWAKVKSQGAAFAYIKATEGTGTITILCYRSSNGFDPYMRSTQVS